MPGLDHAATYAKYLIETHAQVLTASAAPSVSSVYGITQDVWRLFTEAIFGQDAVPTCSHPSPRQSFLGLQSWPSATAPIRR